MSVDIRRCTKEELDAINIGIARYKAERSGVKQSDNPTPLEDTEKARIPVEGTSSAEQLDLWKAL
jgi:hypothetical protein